MAKNRWSIGMEVVGLLIILPLLLALFPRRVPLLPLLLGGAVFCYWRCRRKIDLAKIFSAPRPGWWRLSLLRGAIIALFSVGYCLAFQPQNFLYFPQNHPWIWLMVLVLYPLLSVLPQEIIYRLYFFERVALTCQRPWVAISVGALLFSWVHIIYLNAFALWGTLIAGYIFNWIYWRYRDEPGIMWRLLLEHSLYGLSIFTIGLGSFFFLAQGAS